MSDISKFADELEQLILNHAAEAGIEIAETLVENLVKAVIDRIYGKKKDKQDA